MEQLDKWTAVKGVVGIIILICIYFLYGLWSVYNLKLADFNMEFVGGIDPSIVRVIEVGDLNETSLKSNLESIHAEIHGVDGDPGVYVPIKLRFTTSHPKSWFVEPFIYFNRRTVQPGRGGMVVRVRYNKFYTLNYKPSLIIEGPHIGFYSEHFS